MSLRVIIEQPALPRYRVPVYRELARRQSLDIQVRFGAGAKVPNVEPDGFEATAVPSRYIAVGRREAVWNSSCWQNAGSRSTDVLMLTWNLHHLNLVPALLRAKANGIPTILWGHGYSKRDAVWRRLVREGAARLATALLFYNHQCRDRFLAKGWPAERLHVALNTIDQDPIQRARTLWLSQPERLLGFQVEHNLVDSPVILFVSRLEPENRVDLLLQASAALRREHPRLKTVIIGDGPELPRLSRLTRVSWH